MKRIIALFLAAGIGVGANPTSNQDGMTGVNKTQSAQTLTKGRLQLSGYSHVTLDKQLLVDGEMTRNGLTEEAYYFLIADAYLSLAYGIADALDVALGIPVYYEEINTPWSAARGYDFAKWIEGYSPGGIKLFLKYRLPFSSNEKPWGAAVTLGASAPAFARGGDGIVPRGMEFLPLKRSATDNGSRAFGTEEFETHFTLGITGDFTKLKSGWPLIWHVNGGVRKVGFQTGDERDFDDVVSGSTALEFPLHPYFQLFGEFYHESRFNQLGGPEQFRSEPTTLAFSGVVKTPIGLQLQAGAVVGILRDGSVPNVEHRDQNGQTLETFDMRGSVPLSLVVGLSWSGKVTNPDADKDGILGKKDKCPKEAEDKDGFEDEDGCPDPDNDKDGISDLTDKCPDKAEDMDGFQDGDGCVDPDNDEDGVFDFLDKCPNEAEDKDGFEDEDGCPDPDNDKDGMADGLDKCPNEPETKNSFQDEDGCPDEVIKKGEEIVLQGVFFMTGSAELTSESVPVLDLLATQLTASPKVRLEVQGHTDNVGSAVKNKVLSQKRAESVMTYLIYKGVEKERLQAVGYGKERPVGNNKTATGRAENRRVELKRLE